MPIQGNPPSSVEGKQPEQSGDYSKIGPVQVVVVQQGGAANGEDGLKDAIKKILKKIFPGKDEDPGGSPSPEPVAPAGLNQAITLSKPSLISLITANLPGILSAIILCVILVVACIWGYQVVTRRGVEARRDETRKKEAEAEKIKAEARRVEASAELVKGIGALAQILKDLFPPKAPSGNPTPSEQRFDPRVSIALAKIEEAIRDKSFPSVPEFRYSSDVTSTQPAVAPAPASRSQTVADNVIPSALNLVITPCPYDPDFLGNSECSSGKTVQLKPGDSGKTVPLPTPNVALKQALSPKVLKDQYKVDFDEARGSVNFDIKYFNHGPEDILLLDTRGYLFTNLVPSGSSGMEGACASQAVAQQGSLILHNDYADVPLLVGLDLGHDKQQAQAMKRLQRVYLVLCTAYRAYHEATIVTNESVYRILSQGSDPKAALAAGERAIEITPYLQSNSVRLP